MTFVEYEVDDPAATSTIKWIQAARALIELRNTLGSIAAVVKQEVRQAANRISCFSVV